MAILQIAGITLITTFLVLVIKEQKPTFAFLLILFTGTGIFIYLIDHVQKIILLIETLAKNANVDMIYIKTILKIIGIAYIAEFASHISKDAGLSSMAAKVELAGKILILVLAVPIMTALIETIIAMIPVR